MRRWITNEDSGNCIGSDRRVSQGVYEIDWQPPDKGNRNANIQIEASDGFDTTLATLLVPVANQAPELRILPEMPPPIRPASMLSLAAAPLSGNRTIDPDNDPVSFLWGFEGVQLGRLLETTGGVVRYLAPSPPDPPDAPSVTLSDTDNGTLVVDWDVPTDNGDAPITDYDIRRKITGEDDDSYVGVFFDSTDTIIEVSGLELSTSYDFQIRAKNFTGASDWSSIGTGETGNEPLVISSFTATPNTISVNSSSTLDVNVEGNPIGLDYAFEIQGDTGDGSYGTLKPYSAGNPDRHVYTAPNTPGSYLIIVTVSDDDSCLLYTSPSPRDS